MLTGSRSRRAGILIPLFSMPSTRSWGIGEISDIPVMAGWLESAGHGLVQLLPINEMPPGETSPYSALSAMAIDPLYISIDDLEDFAALGGEEGLDAGLKSQLDELRVTPAIDYHAVRTLKQAVLWHCFARFRETEWAAGTDRATALHTFTREQSWWLDDYALFRALHGHHGEQSWFTWPEPIRTRQPEALTQARVGLADDILYRQYLQWVADTQWSAARRAAGRVALYDDLPFMVSADSADVWSRQHEFRLDASVGVPPDAFSDTGQDWGLPVYRWDVMAAGGFEWLRARARRNAALFDGYRVDHLVGYYRTYFRPHGGGAAEFTPPDQDSQQTLGERVLSVLREPGAEVTAEDLGVVPDFVRHSLARLNLPGYKVFRWERQWLEEGQPFFDPREYPPRAVVTSGTHDTEPLAIWWEGAPREERHAVMAIPSVAGRLTDEDRMRAFDEPLLPHAIREALLETLYESGGDILILPIQDVFGWRDRINQPATVGSANWTWRLPWPSDRLVTEPTALAVATQLHEWASRHGRWPVDS